MNRRTALTLRTGLIACGIAFGLLLASCGGPRTQSENTKPKDEPTKTAAGKPAGIDESNAGTISGKVNFSGQKPEMKIIDMSATTACAKEHSTPQKSEEIVVNGN